MTNLKIVFDDRDDKDSCFKVTRKRGWLCFTVFINSNTVSILI